MKKTLVASLLSLFCLNSYAYVLVPPTPTPPMLSEQAPEGVKQLASRLSYGGFPTYLQFQNVSDKNAKILISYSVYNPETESSNTFSSHLQILPYRLTTTNLSAWSYNVNLRYTTEDAFASGDANRDLCSFDNPYITTEIPGKSVANLLTVLLFNEKDDSDQTTSYIKFVYPIGMGYNASAFNSPQNGNCKKVL